MIAEDGPLRSAAPRIRVVGAAIVDDLARPTQVLAARRTEPPALAGGWEVPGGKVDPGEMPDAALVREIREELGVEITLGGRLTGTLPDGAFPLGEGYAMDVWLAEIRDGRPTPLEGHDALRWLAVGELYTVPWLPDDLPVVAVLARRLLSGGRC